MNLATRTVAIAGGLLAALLAAGCGAGVHTPSGTSAAPAGGGTGRVSAQDCAAYGVYAIEHHITVTTTPAPCQGLSKAAVSHAAAVAILRVAGGERKAMWRKRAAEVAPYLDHLITAPPAAASLPAAAGWSGASHPAARHLGGQDLAMDTAALIAWLVTAGSGAYVLGSWISGGGSLRRRSGPADSSGSPPSVIIGHFGLALAGLVVWAIYMAVGWAALAWISVSTLLPVAGLGMAALTVGLPGRAAAAPAGRSSGASPGNSGDAAAAGNGGVTTVLPVRAPSVRAQLSPLVVVGHGLLAVTTMLLVLLAALGSPVA